MLELKAICYGLSPQRGPVCCVAAIDSMYFLWQAVKQGDQIKWMVDDKMVNGLHLYALI